MKMKSLLLSIMLMISAWSFLSAQTMIDNFDSSDADSLYIVAIEGNSVLTMTDDGTDFVEGTGSLKVNTFIDSVNAWGSFAQLIYRTDSTDVLDWTISDSLSIWIKVHHAPIHPENMVFRIHIADQPAGEPLEEYIYEHATALDVVGDWYQLKIPLFEREQPGAEIPNDEGFILAPTTWGGFTYNNRKLDWDKIVGYNIGMITTGWAPPLLPADSLEVSYDAFERFGTRAVPFIIFNGIAFGSGVQIPGWGGAWGQSTIGIEEGAGPVAGTNAVKWVQGDEWANGWTGFVLESNPAVNLVGAWTKDTLQFQMKAESGVGELRFQFTDGTDGGKRGWNFTPTDDNEWHTYKIALQDLIYPPGEDPVNYGPIDSSAITSIEMMAEATAIAGKVIYITDWWTGNPDFDVIPPDAPTSVIATVVEPYLNSVLWTDVPGETGETYNVYYSENPITDPEAAGVEVLKMGHPENPTGNNAIDHALRAPATDQNVSYYYAVVCKDEAGNKSDISENTSLITNLAEGVTVIHPTAPPGFAADGDLSDWAGITPFRMFPDDLSGTIVENTTIDNDADLSVLAYVAMDNDYLYVAFDVVDDIVATDTTKASYLIDSPDLFIGLYNWHGAPHTSYQTGAEPDNHFRFGRNAAMLDNVGGYRLLEQGDPNYHWDERFDPGYVVEAKISFTDIAAANGDDLFTPIAGMRIPIDFAVNDADATGEREGILTYSPDNQDKSYQDVSRWLYTWIGDQWVGVEDDGQTVLTYELSQNYPNEKSSNVTLRVFDILGREVATLINENQNAGRHVVDFDASNFASGIYLYRLEAGSFIQVKKMILMK
jgi:hypothetical protein